MQSVVITMYGLEGHSWHWQSPEQDLATLGSSRTIVEGLALSSQSPKKIVH